VARYARHSLPLQRLLADIGLTLGGRPGERFATRRAVAASRMTLLRRVRALPEPVVVAPAVLGVDDFALARGRRYGTVLLDMTTHRPVDLLPERSAAALAAWLTAHGQPAVICRDRGGDYAAGARQGAPDAVQVADRWHLLKNVGDALERVAGRQRGALRQAACAGMAGPADQPAAAPLATPPPAARVSAPLPTAAPPDARWARYEAVAALHRQGRSISAISRATGVTRPTVRRWLQADALPARAPRPRRLDALSPHAAYLQARWAAGCRDAAVLWRDLRARGFRGSSVTVRRHVQGWRAYPYQRRAGGRRAAPGTRRAPAAAAEARPPSPRQARWWLLAPPERLTPEQRAFLVRLRAGCPEVAQAAALAVEFGRLVREGDRAALGPWLEAAGASGLAEFREVARGMRRDLSAIKAALTERWSSGAVEGQVTRIKLLKRLAYGRSGFDLLRKRVLLAS
jgi:transposase